MFDSSFANPRKPGMILEALDKTLAIVEFDPDGTIVKTNRKFLDAIGYAEADLLGNHHRMLVHEEERNAPEYRHFWRALADGHQQNGVFRRRSEAGNTIWIQGTYIPVTNGNGTVVRIVKVAEDVTGKYAHTLGIEALVNSIEGSQAMIEFNMDGVILKANCNFLDVMGYRLDEIQGRHHSMFLTPEDAQSEDYKNFWASLREGEFQVRQFHRVGKNGKSIWIQATYTPVRDPDGNLERVVKVAMDVTAQKIINANFESQIEAITRSQAVIEFNLDGIIMTANQNFLDAMGYEWTEIQGQHHKMFVEPGYAESQEYQEFWAALKRGEYQSAEFRRLGKGGKEVWIQASYNPVLDTDGKPMKVVKYATDRTEQVRRREQMAKVGMQVDASLKEIATAVDGAREKSIEAEATSRHTKETVQAVAGAAEQFGASTQEIAHAVAGTRNAAERADSEAQAAGQSTQALHSAANSMNGIVEMIQKIAEQINLLALNATIEAARAGEAGRGFSVVATEVKNLATQVGSAIGQITEEISNVQTVSESVVDSLGAIGREVSKVNESVAGVASAIEEQNAASGDITSNLRHAAAAVGQINGNLDDIRQATEFSSKVAEEEGRKLSSQLHA